MYLAYHYVWKNEINNSKGIKPFINRNMYTGGLGLQKKIFGKEDIEVVMLKLDENQNIIEVNYERAKDYNPKEFSVKYEKVKISEAIEIPLYFKVISWNHLFNIIGKYNEEELNNTRVIELDAKYFSNKEGDEYKKIP